MSGGINFPNPLYPGFYPATLAANAAVGTRVKAEAEHKDLINQYKTFEGVLLGTKDLILEAVENKYLIKIEHETLGFLNKTPRQMLEQRRSIRLCQHQKPHSRKRWRGKRQQKPTNLLQQSGKGNEKSRLK